MLKNMNKRTKLLGGALLLAVAALPGWQSIHSLTTSNARASEIRSQTATLDAQASDAEAAQTSPAFKAADARYAAAVPNNPEFRELIDQLRQAAGNAGVVWVSGTPSNEGEGGESSEEAPADGEPAAEGEAPADGEAAADGEAVTGEDPTAAVQTWTLTIVVEGDSQRVAAFLDQVKTMPRLVVVNSVGLSPQEGIGQSANIAASFFSTGELK